MNQIHIALKDYRKKGFSLIPVGRDKIPLLRSWKDFQDNKATSAQLRVWWLEWPDANVAILTGRLSKIIVIDCDSDETTEAFLADYPEARETLQSRTGRGRHFYFMWTKGVRNSAGKPFGKGIDVRSDGGYVVAPPSIHKNGKQYVWLNSKSIQPLSKKLKEVLTHSPKTNMKPKPKRKSNKAFVEGTRNDSLASLAGTLHAQNKSPEVIFTVLQKVNERECNPPLSEEEIRKIVESISRYAVSGFADGLTDIGNGRSFAAQHGDHTRYCHAWRKWLFWDGTRWRTDDSGEVFRRAKETAKAFAAKASTAPDGQVRRELLKHAKKSQSVNGLKAMITMAQSEEEIGVRPDQLDKNPWFLNVNNGTIDLRTGKLQPHDEGNLITKLAPVDYSPKAKCPKWERFLSQIMNGNREMVYFLQRAIGYCLTGDTQEQALFFLYGTGANGKSTFLNIIREMLGDYAKQAAPELLVNKVFSTHPTDIAELQGRRFVVAVEVDDGKRLAEALVKQITGGDTMSARFMYENNIEFKPVLKLFVATNHMPTIRGTDDGIKRRIKLIPFDMKLSEEGRDKRLLDKLASEMPGVLAWAVKGCLAWQKHGLKVPEIVKDATAYYQKDMDVIAAFIEDQCDIGPKLKVQASRLYQAYSNWCDDNGEYKHLGQSFLRDLTERGLEKKRQSAAYFWYGIGLKGATSKRKAA